tara:strand:- start:206 stop:496 length:291 start_codon:yes stop_codon:yes gene_type:complete
VRGADQLTLINIINWRKPMVILNNIPSIKDFQFMGPDKGWYALFPKRNGARLWLLKEYGEPNGSPNGGAMWFFDHQKMISIKWRLQFAEARRRVRT